MKGNKGLNINYLRLTGYRTQDGSKMTAGQVIGRAINKEGNTIGYYNKDPKLDYHIYDVMFPYRTVNQYASNLITEAIWSEVDNY